MLQVERDYLTKLLDECRKNGYADQHEIGNQLGLNLDATDKLVAALEEQGYIKTVGIGGQVTITESGERLFKT